MRYLLYLLLLAGFACKKGPAPASHAADTTTTTTSPPFDINSIEDTYADVAPLTDYAQWGPYNVHDPSIKKINGEYYCYSTDVAYGATPPAGIQVRKSADLVQWQFVGWAFNGIPSIVSQYISSAGGTPNAEIGRAHV